jgi:hypothetical protein
VREIEIGSWEMLYDFTETLRKTPTAAPLTTVGGGMIPNIE